MLFLSKYFDLCAEMLVFALELFEEICFDPFAIVGRNCVWVLVGKLKTKTKPEMMYLYQGKDAMDLKMEGLKVDPLYCSDGAFDWEKIMGLISPI